MHILILLTHSRINKTSILPPGVQAHREYRIQQLNNYTGLEEKNKALVLKAFDTLFNQRDYCNG